MIKELCWEVELPSTPPVPCRGTDLVLVPAPEVRRLQLISDLCSLLAQRPPPTTRLVFNEFVTFSPVLPKMRESAGVSRGAPLIPPPSAL